MVGEIAHGADRPIVDQRRADHREQLETRPFAHPAVAPVAVAIMHADIDIGRSGCAWRRWSGISVSLMSGYCAVKLPAAGSSRTSSSAGTQETESAPALAGRVMRGGGGGDAVEGARHRRQQLGAVRREFQPLSGALEQLDAERCSSALIWWLMAPCVTLSSRRRLGQRAMARRRLEGAQRIQRGQTLGSDHRHDPGGAADHVRFSHRTHYNNIN